MLASDVMRLTTIACSVKREVAEIPVTACSSSKNASSPRASSSQISDNFEIRRTRPLAARDRPEE